jgi:thiamine-phosphate pyrophosphorylase
MSPDLRLYALVDPEHTGAHDLTALTAAVAQGGATIVQLRDKTASTRVMIERAYAVSDALSPFGVPLIINDRVDVALAVEADGVHIGQDDMPAAQARLLLGRQAIIGLSIKTVEQAQAAPLRELSYVAIGGVFATTSKDNPDKPVGLDGFKSIAAVIRKRAPGFPICAIAGIDATNAANVIAAGADGVAVISALSKAQDPAAAAGALRKSIDDALQSRGRA